MTRVLLVHPYGPSMPPILAAFAALWPEAEVFNILDETLYVDADPNGVMTPEIASRVALLLRYAKESRADGIVFTGTAFGPAVDSGKQGLGIPILKADEAMAIEAAASGKPIALLCTAKRAVKIIRANIEAEALGRTLAIREVVVEGAKDAASAGDNSGHDRLIAEAAAAVPPSELAVLGQISMTPAVALMPKEVASRVLTTPEASVRRLRKLISEANAR